MSTATIKQLERDATRAHTDGDTWPQFYYHHADAIRTAEPYDRGRFHRLVRRLMALVASGNTDGMEPVGDDLEPWERDDQPTQPSDTETQARCDWEDVGAPPGLRVP